MLNRVNSKNINHTLVWLRRSFVVRGLSPTANNPSSSALFEFFLSFFVFLKKKKKKKKKKIEIESVTSYKSHSNPISVNSLASNFSQPDNDCILKLLSSKRSHSFVYLVKKPFKVGIYIC